MLSAFAFVPMRPLGAVRVPADWRFVLAPSGVCDRARPAARRRHTIGCPRHAARSRALERRRAAARRRSGAALASARVGTRASRRADRSLGRVDGWPADVLRAASITSSARTRGYPRARRVWRGGRQAMSAAGRGISGRTPRRCSATRFPRPARWRRRARAWAPSPPAASAPASAAACGPSSTRTAEAFAARWHPAAFVAQPGPAMVELDG